MTKSELIEKLAEKTPHLPAKDVELCVKAVLERMSQALAHGDRVEIRGFGALPCISGHRASAATQDWQGRVASGQARAALQAGEGTARTCKPGFRRLRSLIRS
jgi:hypothetical protein